MKKIELPEELIVELYNNGNGCYKIAKMFNCSPSTINNFLKKCGVKTNKTPNDYRKYTLNQDFFEKINTEEKAYFLGLIYSDGCLYKNILSVSLVENDSYILEKFLFFLESNSKLYLSPPRKPTHQVQKKLMISNVKMGKDLMRLGVMERKSLQLKFPTDEQVSKKFLNHFIRGVFDGDGSVFSYSRTINGKTYIENGVSIISSNDFINGIKAVIGYGNVYGTNEGKNSVISFKKKKDIENISKYMYSESSIYLKRKWGKFVEILDCLENKNYFYGGEKIVQMDLIGNVIKIWDNINQIKRETNYNTQTILRNVKGKIKTSNNFKFKIYDK
jgi:intein-encoded DNA endonuclease-like protein